MAEATEKTFHANTRITWQGAGAAPSEMARALDEQAGAVQALAAEIARRNFRSFREQRGRGSRFGFQAGLDSGEFFAVHAGAEAGLGGEEGGGSVRLFL